MSWTPTICCLGPSLGVPGLQRFSSWYASMRFRGTNHCVAAVPQDLGSATRTRTGVAWYTHTTCQWLQPAQRILSSHRWPNTSILSTVACTPPSRLCGSGRRVGPTPRAAADRVGRQGRRVRQAARPDVPTPRGTEGDGRPGHDGAKAVRSVGRSGRCGSGGCPARVVCLGRLVWCVRVGRAGRFGRCSRPRESCGRCP